MTIYVEFQDLTARVNTLDSGIGSYTARTLHTIDPDGTVKDYAGSVSSSTYIAADLEKALLTRGIWRFAASAVDAAGKLRKTPWYKLFVNGIGEVTG